jgi:hypothetical protein
MSRLLDLLSMLILWCFNFGVLYWVIVVLDVPWIHVLASLVVIGAVIWAFLRSRKNLS